MLYDLRPAADSRTFLAPLSHSLAESCAAVDTLFWGRRQLAFVFCQPIYLTPVAWPSIVSATQALISGHASAWET